MGGRNHYSGSLLLRSSNRAARFEHKGSDNEFSFIWRVLCGTKSFSGKQPRRSGFLSHVLEYKRVLFYGLPAFVCGGRRDYFVCRSAIQVFVALRRAGSFLAAILTAGPSPMDAFWIRMALSRDVRFAGRLDWIVAVYPLVFPYRYPDLIAR